jgi:hypothetical protein
MPDEIPLDAAQDTNNVQVKDVCAELGGSDGRIVRTQGSVTYSGRQLSAIGQVGDDEYKLFFVRGSSINVPKDALLVFTVAGSPHDGEGIVSAKTRRRIETGVKQAMQRRGGGRVDPSCHAESIARVTETLRCSAGEINAQVGWAMEGQQAVDAVYEAVRLLEGLIGD